MHELIPPVIAGLAAVWLAWLKWRFRMPWGRPPRGRKIVGWPTLRDAQGELRAWASVRGERATLIVLMANRCPGVTAYDARLQELARDYAPTGVKVVGINPINEYLYTSESLPQMSRAVSERGINFAYLKDDEQRATRLLGAIVTPQAFVLDAHDRVRYSGRIDDAFVATRVKRHYVRAALDDILRGQSVTTPETPPLGCSIDLADASTRAVPKRWRLPWSSTLDI